MLLDKFINGVLKSLIFWLRILFLINNFKTHFLLSQNKKDLQVILFLKNSIESKILNATAEVESAKLMRQTADILSGKAAMQIRYLEAIKGIASQNNVKVIFLAEENWTFT